MRSPPQRLDRLALLAGLGALVVGCAAAPVVKPEYSGPVFDVHAHLDPEGEGRIDAKAPAGTKSLLAQMRRAHVTTAVAIAVSNGGADSVTAANDALWKTAQAHPGALIAVGTLPSGNPTSVLAEIDRLAHVGFRAVRVVPPEPMDVSALRALVAKAASHQMVVLLDGWGWDPHVVARLALSEPKARLVVAHLGGVRFEGMLLFATLARYRFYARNVWFDLSSVAPLYAGSPYARELVWVARKLGTDRILYGSDFPLVSEQEALDTFRALGFTPRETHQILEANAEALFGAPHPAHDHPPRHEKSASKARPKAAIGVPPASPEPRPHPEAASGLLPPGGGVPASETVPASAGVPASGVSASG